MRVRQDFSGLVAERQGENLVGGEGLSGGVFGVEGLVAHGGAEALTVEVAQPPFERLEVSPSSARAWSAAPWSRADLQRFRRPSAVAATG